MSLYSELHSTIPPTFQDTTTPLYQDLEYGEFLCRFPNNRGYLVIEGGFFENGKYVGVEVTWTNGANESLDHPWAVGDPSRSTPSDPFGVVQYGTRQYHINMAHRIKWLDKLTTAELRKSDLMVTNVVIPPFAARLEQAVRTSPRPRLSMKDWIYHNGA